MFSICSLNNNIRAQFNTHAGKIALLSTIITLLGLYNLLEAPGSFLPLTPPSEYLLSAITVLFVVDAVHYDVLYCRGSTKSDVKHRKPSSSESPAPAPKARTSTDKDWRKLTKKNSAYVSERFLSGIPVEAFPSAADSEIEKYCKEFSLESNEFLIIENQNEVAVIYRSLNQYTLYVPKNKEVTFTYEDIEKAGLVKWKAKS